MIPQATAHGHRPPVATMEEIRRHWDIGEVYAANDILNAMGDADYLAGLNRPGPQR